MIIVILAMFIIFLGVSSIKRYLKAGATSENSTKVAFRNESFILVNKGADLKINSNNKNEQTVQTFLRLHFPDLVNKKLCHEFYFPHRLDYATSGLLCIPQNKLACKIISKAFSSNRVQKYYIAIVRGCVSDLVVNVNVPIGDDSREPIIQKMCTIQDKEYCENSRSAQTLITVMERGLFGGYPATKILCRPLTGRRHQIRVHCSYLGHTIIGDYTYSQRKDVLPTRMFLHAIRLSLPNVLGAFDVSTKDPFSSIKEWYGLKVISSLNKAYKKLDECV